MPGTRCGPPLTRLLRTATFRLTALYLVLFAVSAFTLGGAVYLVARSALRQQMVARIDTESAFLADEFRAGGLDHLLAALRARGRGPSALDYGLRDPGGRVLAGEMPAEADAGWGWRTITLADPGEQPAAPERVLARLTRLDGGFALAVGDDLGRIAEVEEAVATALLWSVGLATLLGIGGGLWLSRLFLAKVDSIARTAQAIIEGDLHQRIPVRGIGDDLDRLAGTLNRMLDRIGTLMDSLRQVGSDVAHDLRTPLSRLHLRLDHARTHARSVPDYQAAVEAALAESEALLETFSALLRIAQVEGATPRGSFREVDLSAVAEAVLDAYRPDLEESGHVLEATLAKSILVRGDRELLTQSLANLIENALRHTPAGTTIALALTRDPSGGARLEVQDNGPGVPVADLPRLTRRFFRAEASRSTPGNGLGLSLVAATADLHGATLDVTDARPGLRVAIRFAAGDAATDRRGVIKKSNKP